jgi:hypothetical protein
MIQDHPFRCISVDDAAVTVNQVSTRFILESARVTVPSARPITKTITARGTTFRNQVVQILSCGLVNDHFSILDTSNGRNSSKGMDMR